MKKLLLCASIVCALPLGLAAISKSDVAREVASAVNNLRLNGLDSSVSVANQQKVVSLWDSAFAKGKQFVLENSKDLLRKEDPDLIAALNKLVGINNDFTNTLKTIRATMPNAPISKLLQVANDAQNVMNSIGTKSFTLPGKKEAQIVLKDLASSITGSARYFYDDLVQKKR
jgi:hypothetical protein